VSKGHDDLARAALERALSHDQLVNWALPTQAEDQKHEADNLRQALRKLDQKLSETRAHCEMLVAEHRRARIVGRATNARKAVGGDQENTMERMKSRVRLRSAENSAAVTKELLLLFLCPAERNLRLTSRFGVPSFGVPRLRNCSETCPARAGTGKSL
jgi:phage shock protein A